ncbi:MAG: hypothetical protein AAFR53_16825, partial [Pseudomonadota bacterium]
MFSRFLLSAAAAVVIASGALAQTTSQAERLADLISKDFTSQALDALNTGLRAEAITLALRALPPDPTEADLEKYAPAMEALTMAAVARHVRLPLPSPAWAQFNRCGDRLLTSELIGINGGVDQIGAVLWSTEDASKIATLFTPQELNTDGFGAPHPVFSPDCTLIAGVGVGAGRVAIFDGRTGALLRDIGQVSIGRGVSGPVFSADGTRLAITDHEANTLTLWDTATWNVVAQIPSASLFEFRMYAPGGAGSEITIYQREGNPLQEYRFLIRALSADGSVETLATFTDQNEAPQPNPGFSQATSPDGNWFISHDANFGGLVINRAGAIVYKRPPDQQGTAPLVFSRDGSSVVQLAILQPNSTAVDIDLATGAAGPADLEDMLPYLHVVFTLDGAFAAVQQYGVPAYGGEDLPRGLALYDELWGALDPAQQAAINEDRVPRL